MIQSSAEGTWLRDAENDFNSLLPVANAATKASQSARGDKAIFKLYSLGVVTARDDWVYDRTDIGLNNKLPWFIERYETERVRLAPMDRRKRRDAIKETDIKLTRALKNDLAANVPYAFDASHNRASLYRPFTKLRLHFWARLNEMQYQLNKLFQDSADTNPYISVVAGSRLPFACLAGEDLPNYALYSLDPAQCLPRYRYTQTGERIDNITDWSLNKFAAQYGKKAGVTKDAIFAYCYAVLHDPVYREKYALNLKREFPRIPFYGDFAQWAGWGQRLLDLHIGYEKAEPFKFTRIDTPNPKRAKGSHPKPKVKSEPDEGLIVVDEDTQLTGIPREAWDYRLGNRSAIDWVLDQHKEKTPRDPTVRAKFNNYRFADYKESMIDLLARVVTVSLETVKIVNEMRGLRETGVQKGEAA